MLLPAGPAATVTGTLNLGLNPLGTFQTGGANTVNVSGPSGAVLILDGATSKVVLRP